MSTAAYWGTQAMAWGWGLQEGDPNAADGNQKKYCIFFIFFYSEICRFCVSPSKKNIEVELQR
jgi:hypothetical protein